MSTLSPRNCRSAFFSVVLLATVPAMGQYSVEQWANFEDGTFPENAIKIGSAPEQTLNVVDLSKVTGMDPAFRSETAAKETGKYALKLSAVHTAAQPITGMVMSHTLDRDSLGPTGRALYQADFYIPGPDKPLPSLAVLAMDSTGIDNKQTDVLPDIKTGFYRFGLTLNKTVFVSLVVPGAETAPFYKNDPQILAAMPRPGWHRFAIVFEGPETIRCYVDGREAFAPIKDATLRKLTVGVALVDKQQSYDAYMDNLSIQMSKDAPVLPSSPYSAGWKQAASSSVGQAAPTPRPVTATTGGPAVAWLEPATAWQKAQQQRIPMLLYFYAPGIPATNRIEQMLANEPAARDFLSKHSPALVDVNQLQGGAIAKRYGVFKVPSFLVISPDAKNYKRSVPSSSDPWSKIASDLTF